MHPSPVPSARPRFAIAAAMALAAFAAASVATAAPICVAGDNGTGTATWPPSPVPGYRSPEDLLMFQVGVAPFDAVTGRFTWRQLAGPAEAAGGSLGGSTRNFTAEVVLELKGTGTMAGYSRTVVVNTTCRADAAPRTAGTSPQSFAADLFQLQGVLPPGDPDFDLLRITAGSGFGMPSPGHTTLTRQLDGNWAVDSFFDITYRIDYVGAPGGPFAGTSNSTVSEARVIVRRPRGSACESDDVGGTGEFPCTCDDGYHSEPDARVSLNGLPPGVPVIGTFRIRDITGTTTTPGGSLGGSAQSFNATVVVEMMQQGGTSFQRTVSIPAICGTESGAPPLGMSVQGFPTDLSQLGGQIIGDPDFDLLRITAGTAFGMPSPGHTTLTLQPNGRWAVDSFFDIEYRIDFVGAPGGPFAGMSGSTTSSSRFEQGVSRHAPTCVAANAGGTAKFPVNCPGGWESPQDAVVSLNGLPPGEPVLGVMALHSPAVSLITTGGPLEGEVQDFTATLDIHLHGTGSLAGFTRSVTIPVTGSTATGPRVPGATPQDFPSDVLTLQGQLPPGDPDFDLLRISAGSGYGLPSPGHTTLAVTPTNDWAVDSFFDITYRIDFVGAPGSPLAGMSGSTQSENRFQIGQGQTAGIRGRLPVALRIGAATPNPATGASRVMLELPAAAAVEVGVYDLAGRRVAEIARASLGAGRHPLRWDGRLASGSRAPAGLYFYRVRAGAAEAVSRVAMVY